MILLQHKNNNNSLGIIHFVGIGGIGMSGIAEIMHTLGYKVQGSDINHNKNTLRLSNIGVKIFVPHSKEYIQNVSYVVISSAIAEDNTEIQEANQRKIPIISRAEMLAEIMRLKCCIAISGSHGKTTTTSLIACLFEANNLCPTVINGGIINHHLTNAYVGKGDYLIVEADESDATFIKIPTTIGVITNIDHEHMNFYKNFDSVKDAFRQFINNLPFCGFCVACIDHPVVREIIESISKRKVITYSIDQQDADVMARNIRIYKTCSVFDVVTKISLNAEEITIKDIIVPVVGRHNILNSLAAIAIALELNFDMEVIKNGFAKFSGVKRRFTQIMEYHGAIIIDDYAHHPEEIKVTLNAAKAFISSSKISHSEPDNCSSNLTTADNLPNSHEVTTNRAIDNNIAQSNCENKVIAHCGRVIAIFQPHRYSRLSYLFDEFTNAFHEADKIFITDVFAAGEQKIDEITGENLAKSINKMTSNTYYLRDINQFHKIIKDEAKPNDIFLFMGAGDITNFANQLPELLRD